jgi:lipopolysaccharide export system permease protein
VRELTIPFLIGTVAVVLMFQANLLIAQLKAFQLQAVPIEAILQILMYKTPFFLTMTLPVGMSIAASLAISRLARESEITAMRSAGASIVRMIVPVTLFGVLVAGANYYLVEKVVPPAERSARKVLTEASILGAAPDFRSNVIIYLRNYVASFGTVSRVNDGSVTFTDVLLVERPRVGEIWFYTAESGSYKDGLWLLERPYVRIFKGEDLVDVQVRKDPLPINERIVVQDLFMPALPEEQTAEEVREAIQIARQQGRDTTSLEVNYHNRFSVPAACIVFALVAPVFALIFARSGSFMGVFLSIVIVGLYYNAFVISTEIFGKQGILSPVVSAWLPNVLFFVLGILALRRLE